MYSLEIGTYCRLAERCSRSLSGFSCWNLVCWDNYHVENCLEVGRAMCVGNSEKRKYILAVETAKLRREDCEPLRRSNRKTRSNTPLEADEPMCEDTAWICRGLTPA